MDLIFNKADRLDSNVVVWAFISYMGLAFEKPQHIRMECFLTGPTCHVSCGAAELHPFFQEVKKYINRERGRARESKRERERERERG